MNSVSKIKWKYVLIFMFICIVLYIGVNRKYLSLTNTFIGTYNCSNNAKISVVSDSLDDNSFYFIDYVNDVYIKGTFENRGNDTYYLFSKNDTLENQYITCNKLSFKLVVNNSELEFEKISETPILPYHIDELVN